jgi:hypothetical protein
MPVLGDISNHYDVVESNGRGMLHLHALVWAKGNVEFAKIRDRVLNDSSFAARMISFLESTIVENVELMTTGIPRIPDRPQHFSTEDESDDSFRKRLDADNNEPKRDASFTVWKSIEPSLPEHIRDFVEREDVKVDADLRASEMADSDGMADVELADPAEPDAEEEPLHLLFPKENLLSAFHAVTRRGHRRLRQRMQS